ncbi:MAG: Hyaluronan synthase [Verrucomicrobiota bacterium]
MSDHPPSLLLKAANGRGLLAADASLRPLTTGNADRRDPSRRSWIGRAPEGAEVILTAGTGLAHLAEIQSSLARDCPALVRAPLAFLSLPEGDLLVESFCPDPSLALLPVNEPAQARRAARAFASACAALARTEEASTEEARHAEWSAWSARVTALPGWQPAEARLLAERVLPALYPRLASSAPVTRWSNGDFTASNLLVSPAGEPRLVDCEHTRRTHVFAEDAARFHVLSAVARQQPELFTPALPRPGPAAQLHFWLRQTELELTHNTTAYVARVWPRRLALIRRLAEATLDLSLDGWSVPPLALNFNIETARWAGDGSPRVLLSGWCHAPAGPGGTAVVLHAGDRLLAEAPLRERPDVSQHLGVLPGCASSGFFLEPALPQPDLSLSLSLLDAEGTLLPFHALDSSALPGRGPFLQTYATWAERHDPDPPSAATAPATGPLFSVLTPVYRSDRNFLRACVDSVLRQHHPQWELILVDDGSGDPDLTRLLDAWGRADPRIRVCPRAGNGGIARATNDALAAARGDFVVLLDHDDVLRPHALAALATRLAADPTLDALYSDEEKISATGERLLPFLKPAFSPEFLRGVMYPGHVLCVRRTVAHAAGGFDPAFDGVQDFEFFLRVTEHTTRIAHLPRILYRWRQSPGSSALHGNVKGDMDRQQAAAVQAHLDRVGDRRRAVPLGGHRVRLEATHAPTCQLVSTRDGSDAMRSLHSAACTSTAEILVLVGPAEAPLSDESLRDLSALAARPDSGCVGALLVTPQGRVVASGLSHDGERFVPAMMGFDASGDGYNGSLRCNREVLAVPPVGVALRRELLLAGAPPPDDWFAFCTALSATGLHHRVCASARLVVPDLPAASASAARKDPFYNPHFEPSRPDYTLASPPVHLPPPARQTVFHFDELPAYFVPHGCVTLRGWCFRRDGLEVLVRTRLGRRVWTVTCDQARPDVAVAHPPGLTDGRCGFILHLRLPGGIQELELEAVGENGTTETLLTFRVAVPPAASLGRILFAPPRVLLAHQLPAWAAHNPVILRPESFPPPVARRETIPALTIVTPSFQQAAFLGETMSSVLDHPPPRLAYIVQDGGSTDGSCDLINHQAGRLHSWRSAPDRGQADAIARGFAKTSGGPDDVMAWINSDDFYLPGALGFVADYFARHPEVEVIYGHRILVDENSQEIGRWFLPKHDPEVLRLNDFVPQETMFWRRRVWDKIGGIDPTFKFALDWDLLLRFQAAGAKIVRVPYFLACFRIHSAQKTSAQMHSVGQHEINRLRERTFGRPFPPAELETNPTLLRYLRRSAFIEFLWKLGLRAP